MCSPISDLSCYINLSHACTALQVSSAPTQSLFTKCGAGGRGHAAWEHDHAILANLLFSYSALSAMFQKMDINGSPDTNHSFLQPCHKGVSRNFKDLAIQEVKTKCFYLQAFLLGWQSGKISVSCFCEGMKHFIGLKENRVAMKCEPSHHWHPCLQEVLSWEGFPDSNPEMHRVVGRWMLVRFPQTHNKQWLTHILLTFYHSPASW